MKKARWWLLKLEPGKKTVGIFHAVEENDEFSKLQFTCSIEIELPLSENSYRNMTVTPYRNDNRNGKKRKFIKNKRGE